MKKKWKLVGFFGACLVFFLMGTMLLLPVFQRKPRGFDEETGLQRVFPVLPLRDTETLDVNDWDETFDDWTETGADPYLDAQDQPTNMISVSGSGNFEAWFDFEDTSFTGTIYVNLSIYCKNDDGSGNDYANVIVDYTGSGDGTDVGDIGQHTDWQYDTINLGTHTQSEVNNLRVNFSSQMVTQPDDVYIDHAYLTVEGSAEVGEEWQEIESDKNGTCISITEWAEINSHINGTCRSITELQEINSNINGTCRNISAPSIQYTVENNGTWGIKIKVGSQWTETDSHINGTCRTWTEWTYVGPHITLSGTCKNITVETFQPIDYSINGTCTNITPPIPETWQMIDSTINGVCRNISSIGMGGINSPWRMVSIPKNDTIDKKELFVRNETNNYTWYEAVDNYIVLNYTYYWNHAIGGWSATDVPPYPLGYDFSGWMGTFIYYFDLNNYSIWINYTTGNGSVSGNNYELYLHENIDNATGTHTYYINETGYVVWANYTGTNITINGTNGSIIIKNIMTDIAYGLSFCIVGGILGYMMFRRRRKKKK